MEHLIILMDEEYSGFNPVQFGYQECAPSHSFGPMARTYWLLHYVISGFGSFTREGEFHSIGPGDIFVIPPYVETYYEADAENPWHYIWIGFEDTGGNLPEEMKQPVLHIPGIGSIFNEMRQCKEMENGRSAFLSSRIWALTSLFLESNKVHMDYVEKALNYMAFNYMNDINVEKIAAYLNLDRSYFSTLFHRRVGLSPGQYLINLRLEKAAELMLIHGESPSIAAISVGYPDLYHFSKVFKKKYGCSPRLYLQKNAAKLPTGKKFSSRQPE